MTQRVAGEHADPYLDWAHHTRGRYLVHGLDGPVRVAGELRPSCTLRSAVAGVNASGGRLSARCVLGTSFFTGVLQPATPAGFAALGEHASFVLAEPGMKSLDPSMPRCREHDTSYRVAAARRRPSPLQQPVVVGVIDGSCGFANLAFGPSPGKTWLSAYWDQGGRVVSGSAWTAPRHTPYGRELDHAALESIARALPASTGAPRIEAERALYRAMDHGVPESADWSHGSHVMDTLLKAWKASSDAKSAQRPGLIHVQLPESALRDTSARWAAAWVLDAVEYIVGHAAPEAKVVINLSLGAFAGPHDGSSLVERFVDAVALSSHGRIAFVIAAGNAGRVLDDGSGSPRQCRARCVLEAADAPQCSDAQRAAALVWDLDLPDSTESFLELWVPRIAGDAQLGVEITLASERVPSRSTQAVGPGAFGLIRAGGDKGPVIAMVVNRTGPGGVPNGRGGMALVALAHTSDVAEASAPGGRWRVTVRNRCNAPLTVDAWIERRDIPGELRGFRPQYGFAADSAGTLVAGALGSLANGRHSIVVGALNPADSDQPDKPADYSSEGFGAAAEGCNSRPVSRRGPDVYSPGRLVGAGYFSGISKQLDGTSIAAAQVSGAMAWAFRSARNRGPAAALDALHADLVQRLKSQVGPRTSGADLAAKGPVRPADTSGGGFEVTPFKSDG